MRVLDIRITPESAGLRGFTVEFIGEGGELVSVSLKDDGNADHFNKGELVEKAKAVMIEVANAPVARARDWDDRQDTPSGEVIEKAERSTSGRW